MVFSALSDYILIILIIFKEQGDMAKLYYTSGLTKQSRKAHSDIVNFLCWKRVKKD